MSWNLLNLLHIIKKTYALDETINIKILYVNTYYILLAYDNAYYPRAASWHKRIMLRDKHKNA